MIDLGLIDRILLASLILALFAWWLRGQLSK